MTDAPGFDEGTRQVVRPSTRAGGTLRLCASADVDSLDPARTYYVWSWLLQRVFQRTVMAFSPEPGAAGLRPVPDLALEPGQPDRSGTTWTYRLCPGVRYEDGTPITARDVKYGIERVFAQDVLPGGPTYLIDLLDDPASPYPGPYRDSDPDRLGLAAVEIPDERTLVFHLRRPFADFDYLMTQPNTAPVPRHADTGSGYGLRPLASGPYRIARYVPGRKLVLARNSRWDRATDPIRSALPDELVITMGLDVDEMDEQLIAGDFDLDVEGRGVQHAAAARIMACPGLKAAADNPVTGFLQYVTIQPGVAPFDDVRCRRAVHYAADLVALQLARGGPVTGGEIASTALPPTFLAHEPADLYPAGQDRRGDVAAARRELAAAGYPDGFRTVIATQRGKFRKVADALAEALSRVGIRADVRELDVASYYTTGIGLPEAVRREGLGLAITDWGADFPTEYGFLGPLVHGQQIKPSGGNFNVAELDDREINSLIDRALSTASPAERRRIWAQVDRRVMEHAVILPIVYDKTLHYRGPRTTNVYVHRAFGLYDVQAVGLADPPNPPQ